MTIESLAESFERLAHRSADALAGSTAGIRSGKGWLGCEWAADDPRFIGFFPPCHARRGDREEKDEPIFVFLHE
jgi:hypothetical protein